MLPLRLNAPPVIDVLESQPEPRVLIVAFEICTFVAVMFVDIAFVLIIVPMEALVTLAFVICALADVIPVVRNIVPAVICPVIIVLFASTL